MNNKILITGGAGFIGSNLVRKIIATDCNVIVYDNLSQGSADNLPNKALLHKGDIRNTVSLRKSMSGVNTVVHLAAYGSVVDSVADPQSNFDINVQGTLNVLETALQSKVQKVIFASTGGALIGEAIPPVDENSLPKPISPYGASKLCGEAYCHAYAKSYGLETVCLRFANVYGPFSAHKKGAVTKFINCLLTNQSIPIYGDGSASRDFLHVDDLCKGILAAINTKLLPGEVYHLASGIEVQVKQLANILIKLAKKNEHLIKYLDTRPGEVTRNFAKYEKAKKILNFQPTLTLEQGLKDTWEWFINSKNK